MSYSSWITDCNSQDQKEEDWLKIQSFFNCQYPAVKRGSCYGIVTAVIDNLRKEIFEHKQKKKSGYKNSFQPSDLCLTCTQQIVFFQTSLSLCPYFLS